MPIFSLIVAAIALFSAPIQHHAVHEQHLQHQRTEATATAPSTTTPSTSTAPSAGTAGYLGDRFGGGTGNPCNFASGYAAGDICNPEGQTEQEYIANPGGPSASTPTNAQGCYYVKMDEGYCPSTGAYVPMADPNEPNAPMMQNAAPGAPVGG